MLKDVGLRRAACDPDEQSQQSASDGTAAAACYACRNIPPTMVMPVPGCAGRAQNSRVCVL